MGKTSDIELASELRRKIYFRLSLSLKSLPVLKYRAFFSGTETTAPVRGLRPIRAWRRLTEKDPNPLNSTRPPGERVSEISSKITFTTLSRTLRVRCGFLSAIREINSDLIIFYSQPIISNNIAYFLLGTQKLSKSKRAVVFSVMV